MVGTRTPILWIQIMFNGSIKRETSSLFVLVLICVHVFQIFCTIDTKSLELFMFLFGEAVRTSMRNESNIPGRKHNRIQFSNTIKKMTKTRRKSVSLRSKNDHYYSVYSGDPLSNAVYLEMWHRWFVCWKWRLPPFIAPVMGRGANFHRSLHSSTAHAAHPTASKWEKSFAQTDSVAASAENCHFIVRDHRILHANRFYQNE